MSVIDPILGIPLPEMVASPHYFTHCLLMALEACALFLRTKWQLVIWFRMKRHPQLCLVVVGVDKGSSCERQLSCMLSKVCFTWDKSQENAMSSLGIKHPLRSGLGQWRTNSLFCPKCVVNWGHDSGNPGQKHLTIYKIEKKSCT